jgi:hypothetical protein
MRLTAGLRKAFLPIIAIFLFSTHISHAQQILGKVISIEVSNKPLPDVLKLISQKGNFYFSYNNNIIRPDSLVSITAVSKTVKQILDQLLEGNYGYKETGNYIILQRNVIGQPYAISGYVVDKSNGQRIPNVSVYEKNQLISTLTNDQGFFRIRLKDKERYPTAIITVSKDLYTDTSLILKPGYDQEINVSIGHAKSITLMPVVITQYSQVEKTWLGRLFLSSRQRVQSLNLNKFFTDQQVQTSVAPGLGSHGKLGAQVINKFSLNIIGGYTAGLDGVEIGGLFNIDKKDVQYVQAAGIFNVVGGRFRGVQIAGLHNNVLDSLLGVEGVQATGFSNLTKGPFSGMQIGGIYNQIDGKLEGVQASGFINIARGALHGGQIAGIYNQANDTMTGFQASGFINVAHSALHSVQVAGVYNQINGPLDGVQASSAFNVVRGDAKGLQVAALGNISKGTNTGVQTGILFNYAKVLTGVQFGLINIADSSSGYSIGALNLVKKGGYHKLSIFTNEVLPLNVAIKTGNHKLYSILTAGMTVNPHQKAYAFGFGAGKAFTLSQKLVLTTEITTQTLYLGDWDYTFAMYRLQPALNIKLGNKISLFAGPAIVFHNDELPDPVKDYKSHIPGPNYPAISTGDGKIWIGWNAGINFF